MSALDDLQAVMFEWKDQDTVIKPKLRQLTGRYSWRLQIVDEDSFLANGGDFAGMPGFNSSELDTCVNWTEEKLKEWPLYNVLLERYRLNDIEARSLSSFLLEMLKWKPKDRASARDLLKHPWLKEND